MITAQSANQGITSAWNIKASKMQRLLVNVTEVRETIWAYWVIEFESCDWPNRGTGLPYIVYESMKEWPAGLLSIILSSDMNTIFFYLCVSWL